MNYTVRKGKKEDLPQVLQLVKELAEYEKAPGEVTNTIGMMEQDAFGENPVFSFFVAESDEKIAGIAIYYIKYSTWKGKCLFLEDIVVTQSLRGKGIGKQLFLAVAETAARMKAPRMEWQVLDWNESAIGFYRKLQASFDHEWINCKLTDVQLATIHASKTAAT